MRRSSKSLVRRPPSLVLLREDGSTLSASSGDPIRASDDLASGLVAAGTPAILIAPATAVRLLRLDLPPRRRREFLSAVEYAVEDRLAADVDELHICTGSPQDGSVLVAVVDRQRLTQWHAAAERADVQLTAIVPQPVCLPAEPGAWTVLIDGPTACVRCDPLPGFGCDVDLLPDLLRRRLAELTTSASCDGVRDLIVHGPPPPELPLPVRAGVPGAAAALDLIRANWTMPTITLSDRSDQTPNGIGARVAAGAFVLLALAGVGATGVQAYWSWQFQAQLDQTRQAIVETYRSAAQQTPHAGSRVVLDPRRQMQQLLDAHRRDRGEAMRFSALVLALEDLVAATPDLRVRDISLSGERYRILIDATSGGAPAQIAAALADTLTRRTGRPVPVDGASTDPRTAILQVPRR